MNPKILSAEISTFLNISKQAFFKKVKEKDIKYKKSGNRFYFEHHAAKQIFKLFFNSSCWTWQNLKGGVGKTHLSFATAVRLSLYGARVAVIDLDQQSNFTQDCWISAENKPVLIDVISDNLDIKDCMVNVCGGLDILPSRIENAVLDNLFANNSLPVDRVIKKLVNKLKENYDFVFIDCPPSLGQSAISASLSADHIIIPVDPEKFSLSGLNVTMRELEKNVFNRFDTYIDVKVLLNKFDGRTSLSHKTLKELATNPSYKDKLFETFVRSSQEFPNSVSRNKTIFDSLKSTTAKEDIDLLAKEMIFMTSSNAQEIVKEKQEALEE